MSCGTAWQVDAEMDETAQLRHARQLIQQLYDSRPSLCDVEIHCVNDVVGENVVVLYAHRAILAAKCRCARSTRPPPCRPALLPVTVRQLGTRWAIPV